MTETQVFSFHLSKPETETETTPMAMGMTFLDHQDSKVPIIKNSKVGVFGKDFGVPNRKRLIIIPNPKALKNNHQDSKPINKNSGYRERVRKLLTESFSNVSSETDEKISPSIDPVQMAATVMTEAFSKGLNLLRPLELIDSEEHYCWKNIISLGIGISSIICSQ